MATGTRGNIPARRTSQSPQTGTIQLPRPSSKIKSFAGNQDSTSSQKQIPTHLKSTTVSKQQSKRPTPGDTAHKMARNPSSLYTRSVISSGKKRFIYVKKQDIGTSAAATKEQLSRSPHEKVEVSNAYDVPQPEQNSKDQASSINKTKEEAVQVGSSNDTKAADVLAQEPSSNQQTKAENGKDGNLNNDKQDITLVVKTEDVSQVAETVSNINQECADEISSRRSKTDENVVDNPTSEVEELNKETEKTLVSDKKEAVGTESGVPESKETEAQEVGWEEKPETEDVAAKTQVPKGKKESVVSNDVIEETASRLREQRKNKVKALAGAFETVISLQEQR